MECNKAPTLTSTSNHPVERSKFSQSAEQQPTPSTVFSSLCNRIPLFAHSGTRTGFGKLPSKRAKLHTFFAACSKQKKCTRRTGDHHASSLFPPCPKVTALQNWTISHDFVFLQRSALSRAVCLSSTVDDEEGRRRAVSCVRYGTRAACTYEHTKEQATQARIGERVRARDCGFFF